MLDGEVCSTFFEAYKRMGIIGYQAGFCLYPMMPVLFDQGRVALGKALRFVCGRKQAEVNSSM